MLLLLTSLLNEKCLLKMFPGLLVIPESHEPKVKVVHCNYLDVLLWWLLNILTLLCCLYFWDWDQYLHSEKSSSIVNRKLRHFFLVVFQTRWREKHPCLPCNGPQWSHRWNKTPLRICRCRMLCSWWRWRVVLQEDPLWSIGSTVKSLGVSLFHIHWTESWMLSPFHPLVGFGLPRSASLSLFPISTDSASLQA